MGQPCHIQQLGDCCACLLFDILIHIFRRLFFYLILVYHHSGIFSTVSI